MTLRNLRSLLGVVCFLLALLCSALQGNDTLENAFASLQRDGKPYKTFYNNYIAPHAVLEKQIVFTTHQDGGGCPIVDAYKIEKKKWLGPVRASKFGLGADTHGNPSICIDGEGHLHVFFGCHGRAMKHVRSTAPYDIARWEEMSSPTPRATYSQSMRMKVIVPSRQQLVSPRDGKWEVLKEMPKEWPELVKRLLLSPGPAAFGGKQPNKWFIHFKEGPAGDPTATYVWLGHIDDGYAAREGGPAKPPVE